MAELKTLIPFDFKKHKPQDIGLGGPSTEYLITVDSPEGGVMVIPSIWWDEQGSPRLIDNQNTAVELAKKYERDSGKQFPRFGTKAYKEADRWAASRSKAGGASKGALAQDVRQEQAKAAKTFTDAL